MDTPVGRIGGLICWENRMPPPQYIPRSALGDDFPVPLPDPGVFGRGGAAIVEPTWGEVIAGPLYDRDGLVVADCDRRAGLHAKRWFDAVGHYSRADVLSSVSSVGEAASVWRTTQ